MTFKFDIVENPIGYKVIILKPCYLDEHTNFGKVSKSTVDIGAKCRGWIIFEIIIEDGKEKREILCTAVGAPILAPISMNQYKSWSDKKLYAKQAIATRIG